MNKKISHRLTKFDLTCEENKEYRKAYNNRLSYGYYTLFKETGKLPAAWYEHLIDIQKAMPEDIDMDSLEYQEFKRRFHRKLSFSEYLRKPTNKKSSPKIELDEKFCKQIVDRKIIVSGTTNKP